MIFIYSFSLLIVGAFYLLYTTQKGNLSLQAGYEEKAG